MGARLAWWGMLVLLLGSLPGCSFLFVDGPPSDHVRREHFTCTTSRLGPIVDTVFTVAFGAQAVDVALDRERTHRDARSDLTLGLFAVGVAGLFGLSAYVGYDQTGECSDALEALQTRRTLEAPTAVPAQPEPGAAAGCVSNAHCKVGRVCMQGSCVNPAPPTQVIVPSAPPPNAPPPNAPPPVAPTNEAPVLLFEGLAPPTPTQPQTQPTP